MCLRLQFNVLFLISGKKGKKSKGKTVSLNDFLSIGGTAEDGSKVIVAAPTSWLELNLYFSLKVLKLTGDVSLLTKLTPHCLTSPACLTNKLNLC